jgi:hypothetical protein
MLEPEFLFSFIRQKYVYISIQFFIYTYIFISFYFVTISLMDVHCRLIKLICVCELNWRSSHQQLSLNWRNENNFEMPMKSFVCFFISFFLKTTKVDVGNGLSLWASGSHQTWSDLIVTFWWNHGFLPLF